MNDEQRHLLEQYIVGKDQDKFQVLEKIYLEKAEVEFKINSPNITFPGKIAGNRAIAKTLSADFNKRYEKVKTYYLSKKVKDNFNISEQPWLVVMKEIGNELSCVGSGCYDWVFIKHDNELKILKQKIYIHVMLEIQDPRSEQLQDIQEKLEYPWAERHVAAGVLKGFENLTDITKYLTIKSI